MHHIRILDDLVVGEYYWARDRIFKDVEIVECKEEEGHKYLGQNRIWATEDNNQAFERWDIFGAIEPPSESMWECAERTYHAKKLEVS